jgi:hypothetical protein
MSEYDHGWSEGYLRGTEKSEEDIMALHKQLEGWRATAAAMLNEAEAWQNDGQSRYDKIEILFLNADLRGSFVV